MSNKEIAEWLRNAYEKSKSDGLPSREHGFSRSEGTTGTIFITTGGEVHGITKQALADALGDDDELASAIWHWIQP